jgi:hypothetical protein
MLRIKIDLKEIRFNRIYWIHLSKNLARSQDPVSTVRTFGLHNSGECFDYLSVLFVSEGFCSLELVRLVS